MKNAADDAYRRALDFWEPPPHAGEPLICVATSYTFDAAFFETECVGRFLNMDAHPTESSSIAYLIEREEKLAGARIHALVDRRHARDKESLRWDILGVLVPKGRVQHAKLSLLVWNDHVRVIVGSGNLSEPGYRKNVEVFATLDASRQTGGAKEAIVATIAFLREVEGFAVGTAAADAPKARLRRSLDRAVAHLASWAESYEVPSGMPVFNTPSRSALEQLHRFWPAGGPPREAYVVSPFFDHAQKADLATKALKTLMAQRGSVETCFYVKTEPMPDGRVRVYAPEEIAKTGRSGETATVYSLLPLQRDEVREVHSKLLSLGNEHWRVLMIGSSNFTAAGLGLEKNRGNLEANLAFKVRTSDSDFSRVDNTWPDYDERPLDASLSQLHWEPAFELDEDGGAGAFPLPAGFQEALFVAGESPALKLTLAAPLPQAWSIRVPGGSVVFAGGPEALGEHVSPWREPSPPFVLEVQWRDAGDGEQRVASWPVNVLNPGALPPPEALRNLTLDELIEILSSTRPLPAAVAEVLDRRRKGKTARTELDPLRRFDSQAFLLRRTKRVARALDSLREHLERPALTEDAFEWRLRGVVGPMALADAFVSGAKLPGEAQFCLAELALALRRVDEEAAAMGGLSAPVIRELLAAAIGEIEKRALELVSEPPRSMLDKYVIDALREAATR